MDAKEGYAKMVPNNGELNGDEDEGSDEWDEDEDEKAVCGQGTCVWKIVPCESLYELSMLRIIMVADAAGHHGHWSCWAVFKVLFLLFCNGALQLTVVARVQSLVDHTRADRVDSVFAPTGNCGKKSLNDYVGIGNRNLGTSRENWDCGPLYPLLMSNSSFLDVNKDGYWSEADNLAELSAALNDKFSKQGDLERIYSEFMLDAKDLKFLAQVKRNIGMTKTRAATANFTRIPMAWMVEQQPISSMCNNVDPELCGSLEVRGILQEHFPDEPSPIRRVRNCRATWNWCNVKFGELFRNYRATAAATCESVSPKWDPELMVTINRYARADKYSPRVNPQAILTPVYETFLLLVLIIWWLTVLSECRAVLSWWMGMMKVKGGSSFFAMDGRVEVQQEDDKITVTSLSFKAKAVIVILVLVPRTIIIVILSIIGTDFLIIADSYADLILNSVALGFLIEVDNMLFAGIASEADQEDLAKLQPIEGEHSCCTCCIDFVRWQTSIVLIVGVAGVSILMAWKAYIIPFGKEDLQGAYECLCHAEGADCVVAQLFGNTLEVPAHMLLSTGKGRAGKAR